MERQVMWSPWTGPGLEHLHLLEQQEGIQEGILADGLILGVKEQVPFRIRYTIHCDLQWRLRAVHLSAQCLVPIPPSLHRWRRVLDGRGWRGDPFTRWMPGCRYLGHTFHQHTADPATRTPARLLCNTQHGVYRDPSDAHRSHPTALYLFRGHLFRRAIPL